MDEKFSLNGIQAAGGHVSGDSVVFVGDAMTPVVSAVNAVTDLLSTRPVVVGGLAVLCRLTRAYRATVDLDLVDRSRQSQRPPQLEILRSAPGAKPVEPAAAIVPTPSGPVKVDVIAVNQAEIDMPSDDSGDRLHATSHAWANDTATEVSMSVVAADGTVLAESAALVAQPGPLVAMKLQAVMNRTADKEGTDLLDIVRLTLDPACGPLIGDQIQSCSTSMRNDIALHVHGWFYEKQHWSLERMRRAGGLGVTEDDLDLVAELLLAACAPPVDQL